LCPSLVPATLALALSLAVSADALFQGGIGGAAFPVWIAMTVASLVGLAWRRELAVPREAAAWLGAAVFFSLGLMWRDSEQLQAFDFLATVGSLLMAAATVNAKRAALFVPRIRHTVFAIARTLRTLIDGFPILVFRETADRYDVGRWGVLSGRALRIGLVGGVLLLVFGSLLGSADPIFASFVSLPNIDPAVLVRHAVVIGLVAWVVGGWARGALVDKPDASYRIGASPWQLDRLEITTAFVTLIALFSAFIVAQLGWLFGGEAFLRARTGLTAAAYARQGFFQMVWVVVLVIPILVGTRAALRSGRTLARLHSRLALPVVGLLAAIVVSAALRMRLYVQYYGLSTDRLYPLVFMAWLAFVLVWLSVTTLRGHARRFGPGVVLSGLTTLAGMNLIVADAVVARVNVARSATSTTPLDVRYLTTLSAEAAEPAVLAVLADGRRPLTDSAPQESVDRCAMLNRVLGRWGSSSAAGTQRAERGAWRSHNLGEANALRVVFRHEVELERLRREACVRAELAKQKPTA
jgi:uncharacterized protein DUF4153